MLNTTVQETHIVDNLSGNMLLSDCPRPLVPVKIGVDLYLYIKIMTNN